MPQLNYLVSYCRCFRPRVTLRLFNVLDSCPRCWTPRARLIFSKSLELDIRMKPGFWWETRLHWLYQVLQWYPSNQDQHHNFVSMGNEGRVLTETFTLYLRLQHTQRLSEPKMGTHCRATVEWDDRWWSRRRALKTAYRILVPPCAKEQRNRCFSSYHAQSSIHSSRASLTCAAGIRTRQSLSHRRDRLWIQSNISGQQWSYYVVSNSVLLEVLRSQVIASSIAIFGQTRISE